MAAWEKMLTDEQSDFLDRLVASGRYRDVSEALRAGVRLLEEDEIELAELRKRLEAGVDQIRRGEFAPGTGEDAIRRAFALARAHRA